jgi:hypothetical protein
LLPLLLALLLAGPKSQGSAFEGTYYLKAGTVEGTLIARLEGADLVRFDLEMVNLQNAHFGILDAQTAVREAGSMNFHYQGAGTCALRFKPGVDELNVEPLGSEADCGFGVGISAAGAWRREGAFLFEGALPQLAERELAEIRSRSSAFAEAERDMLRAVAAFRGTLKGVSRKAFTAEQRDWVLERDARAREVGPKGSPEHLEVLVFLTRERAQLLTTAMPPFAGTAGSQK